MTKTNDTKSYKKEISLAIFFIAFILIMWGCSWWYIESNFEINDRGTFGDQFGAVNSLFSGFAFAGIIFTILLQRKELELQRKELEETREVFKQQNDVLSQQKFENTFFQMLNNYNSIVNNLNLIQTVSGFKGFQDKSYEGRRCFDAVIKDFQGNFYSDQVDNILIEKDPQNGDENSKMIKILQLVYQKTFDEHDTTLSHYFRNMYHIVKYVHLSKVIITKSEKQFYINILRAQLSSNELIMLYYNLIVVGLGYPKFIYLAYEYDFLQNMNWEKMSVQNSDRGKFESNIEEYKNIFEELAKKSTTEDEVINSLILPTQSLGSAE